MCTYVCTYIHTYTYVRTYVRTFFLQLRICADIIAILTILVDIIIEGMLAVWAGQAQVPRAFENVCHAELQAESQLMSMMMAAAGLSRAKMA